VSALLRVCSSSSPPSLWVAGCTTRSFSFLGTHISIEMKFLASTQACSCFSKEGYWAGRPGASARWLIFWRMCRPGGVHYLAYFPRMPYFCYRCPSIVGWGLPTPYIRRVFCFSLYLLMLKDPSLATYLALPLTNIYSEACNT